MLRETLNSVLAQTFPDFEVIVGNDYTAEVLTGEMLGINDPRIRFVNHPRNLREVGNMNALLAMATGSYFTWLFDDDLYEPDFLQTAHDCLTERGFPPAYFPSYRILIGEEEFLPQKIEHSDIIEFTGRGFLRWYSAFQTQVFPTYGLFDTEVLKNRLGGFEELIDTAVGLYSEYFFLIKCGLLDRIIYSNAPLYVFRQHEGSWSESNVDLKNYLVAGQELICRSSEVLRNADLVEDYSENLLTVCSLHLIEFAHKSGRYVYYISENAQKKFGIRAAFSAIARHWRTSWKTRRLYLALTGDRTLHNLLAFLKVILFCNYLMLSQLSYYFYKRSRD